MPAGPLWMSCGFLGGQGAAPLSTVDSHGTWWLPSEFGGSVPQVR
jgi:hypothetical protein